MFKGNKIFFNDLRVGNFYIVMVNKNINIFNLFLWEISK